MWKTLFNTPLAVTNSKGKLAHPRHYRIWDRIAQYLWPVDLVVLSYAGEMFDELVHDTHTIFRFVFCTPSLSETLRSQEWQKNPVGVFLDGFSPETVNQLAFTTFAHATRPILESLPEETSQILNKYDKVFAALWSLREQTLQMWSSVAYYAILSFACQATSNPCLLDSGELARLISAFNTRPDFPAIKPCLSSLVDSVTARFTNRFGVPTPVIALLIVAQSDKGLSVAFPVFKAFIDTLRAGKLATSWYIKDAVYTTEEQYPTALRAEQVPEAVMELASLALESGTDFAVDTLVALVMDLRLPIEDLPVEYIVLRSRFSPFDVSRLVYGLMHLAEVPAERFLAAALTHPISTKPFVLNRDRTARMMTIQAIIKHTTRDWQAKTVIDGAFDTHPDWAPKMILAWTNFENADITPKDALTIAAKLDVAVITQLAIVLVDNAPDRAQIVAMSRSTVHNLLFEAIKRAAKDDAWKPVLLRLAAWIDNPLEELLATRFKPKPVVKGRKRSHRVELIPSPLTALLVYKLFDLIEPFCAGMPPVSSFGVGLRMYLCKHNLQHIVPVLARALGISQFSVSNIIEICTGTDGATAQDIIEEFNGVHSLEKILVAGINKDHIRRAVLTLMRRNGEEPRDIVNRVLRVQGLKGSKRILALAENLYGCKLRTDQVYQAFVDQDNDTMRELIERYRPIVFGPMPEELWQAMTTVWSTSQSALNAYAKAPPNLLVAAIRYRRQDVVDMLCDKFPEMVVLCCKRYADCVCEACWLSQTDVAQRLLGVWQDADMDYIESRVLPSIFAQL